MTLMDVVSEDVDLMEQVAGQESIEQLRWVVDTCLDRPGEAGDPPAVRAGHGNSPPPKRGGRPHRHQLCIPD